MDIYEIIGKILGAIFVALLAWLAPKVEEWLKTNTTAREEESIRAVVRSFCRAAEQLLKEDDPTGSKRNAYVVEHLEQLGIAVTESVIAMIEGEVFDINKGAAK